MTSGEAVSSKEKHIITDQTQFINADTDPRDSGSYVLDQAPVSSSRC